MTEKENKSCSCEAENVQVEECCCECDCSEDCNCSDTEQSDALQNAAQKAEQKINELNDRLMRTIAEYDNFRKRSQKEKDAIYPDAIALAVSAFLPVMDNFERALAAPCSDDSFKQGIEMILTQMKESFTKLNVVTIDPQGEPFNPEEHNAVMHVEDDSVGESVVIEVFQKGYKLNEKVIRFAMVKVAN